MSVESLDDDDRSAVLDVADPAALLVAKPHKVGERFATPNRLNDKDAHDICRLLVAIETPDLAETMQRRHADEISQEATTQALNYLGLPSASAGALGATIAAPKKEPAGQTLFRLRSASSRRTCCRPWRDPRRGPAVLNRKD